MRSLRWGFLIIFATLFCAFGWPQRGLAESEYDAVSTLTGPGEKILTDSSGYKYHVFDLNADPKLQALVDHITSILLNSNVGMGICRDLLDGKAELIAYNLGVSQRAAEAAATICTRGSPSTETRYLVDGNHNFLRKYTFDGRSRKRHFYMVVSDRPDLPVDSWTDAFTNTTTIFVHHSSDQSDLSMYSLIQLFAHEMAIYFDAKSWPFGPEWSAVAKSQNLEILEGESGRMVTASQNPAIATVLSSVRAFKLERNMIRDLMNLGLLPRDRFLTYPTAEMPFLKNGCSGTCLQDFVLKQQDWLKPLYQPLLALAPTFRQKRMEELGLVATDEVVDALIRIPVALISKMGKNFDAINFFTLPGSESWTQNQEVTERVLGHYLNEDLLELVKTQVKASSSYGGQKTMDLLTYLSLPLLSDRNSLLASGPRPRIRTGATK